MSGVSNIALYNVDLGAASIALLVLSLLLAATGPFSFFGEICSFQSMAYSKFVDPSSNKCQVPTRIGMLCIYTPATTVLPIAIGVFGYGLESWSFGGVTTTPRHWAIAALFFMLFFKRVLEVSFLSKFSGKIEASTMVAISLAYVNMAVIAVLTGVELAFLPPEANDFSPLLIAGIIVTLLGAAGNLYHHFLLANLRKPGEKSYKIPKGGLFWLTPTPHYLFESAGWLGFAMAAGHIAVFLSLFMFTLLYLSGRSVSTVRWYRDKANQGAFDEPLPAMWKRYPFVDFSEDNTVSA